METETAKPEFAPVPIWRCTSKECRAWVRDELASEGVPACPMCQGRMIRGIKHLPKLIKKHKAVRKKTDETLWVH